MGRFFSCQLGSTIPKILLLFFVADVALRFFPIDFLTFRGWEAMERYPLAEGPFEPNKRYHNDRVHGDLANLSNIPELREYRSETFTSDAYGFRNPPGLVTDGPPDALLIGSSFSAGAGLSDEETLSVQLSAISGRKVYNASGMDAEPKLIRGLARRLRMSAGLVICEHLERYDLPLIPPIGVPGGDVAEAGELSAPAHGRVQKDARLKQWLKERGFFQPLRRAWYWLSVSPLEIAASQACRSLQNDRLLPNRSRDTVSVRRLRNGELMIFPRISPEPAHEVRRVDRAEDYWSWLAAELKKDNLTLVVLLVPEKYTVYRSLLADPPPVWKEASFLDVLERKLDQKGVPVVNMTAPLTQRAAAELQQGKYVYWRDDTHWNPRGVALAAAEIRQICNPLWPQSRDDSGK